MRRLLTQSIPKNQFEMETWSDQPIHPNFRVKFFIDTNILVYLVDKTFLSLCDFVYAAKSSNFIELVSSKYVIFEFVGVRKKEHYLRKVAASSKLSTKGEINFTSLLKYQNRLDDPLVPFDTVISDIKKDIDQELNEIATNYKIDYNYSTLHDDQLSPTSEICLTTKIANQDSLVLVSAILPQRGTVSHHMQVLTNDGEFANFSSHPSLDTIFSSLNVERPSVIAINNIIGLDKSAYNLTQSHTKANVEQHLKDVILRLIVEKNTKYYLGKTFPPASSTFPKDVICFKHNLNQPAVANVYITVISKDLNFVYTSSRAIVNLQYKGNNVNAGDIFSDDTQNHVAYKLLDYDVDGNPIQVDTTIIDAIRAEGNLVFIHPDSTL